MEKITYNVYCMRENYSFESLQFSQAYNIINGAAKCIGIDDGIGTHTLRKTFGYFAYKAGTDIVLLQQIFN
ncbi:MAG: site-specific integrase, partial [Candidatus Pristimantibacillus sp.]